MKFIYLLLASFIILLMVSCQKELQCDYCTDPVSSGTLKQNATGDCLPASVNGTYKLNVLLTATNYIDVQVDVAVAGSYLIQSDTINGFFFRTEGTFTATGINTVRLAASGKPLSAGINSFMIHYGSSICAVDIAVIADPTTASFTLSGAPGLCQSPVVNGLYQARIALNNSHTVTIKVNVTVPGPYTITTNTVNGIFFSATGSFTSPGIGIEVILKGTGIPLNQGVSTLTPQASGSSCTFNLTIEPEPAARLSCTIDGIFYNFYDRAGSKILNDIIPASPVPYLFMSGYTGPDNGSPVPKIELSITYNSLLPVGPGTYFTVDGILLPNGYDIQVKYMGVNPDLSVGLWYTNSGVTTPPFTIVVSSITAYRVSGIFSGKLGNSTSPLLTKVITEGEFDLPIQ